MLECSVDPHPADRADRVDPCDTNDTVLTWTPGPFADRHDVYFGTEANNVVYQDTVDGNMYPEVGNLALEVGRTSMMSTTTPAPHMTASSGDSQRYL
ncbi:MAG: hypothetical protein ACYTBJ_24780 [Planctomycetota bacterium]|jgi:hypothetical protein